MSETYALQKITSAPDALTLKWADGRESEYASIWLRDNRASDRDAHSGQRLIDVLDVPQDPRIRAARQESGGVRIEWEDDSSPTDYPLAWLAQHAAGADPRPELRVRTWLEGGTLDARSDFAWASLPRLSADPRTRLNWLTHLVQDGLAFLEDVPAREPAIIEAMTGIGRVLETNYGLTFDVRSVPQPENLAYSDLGLGLHTDNPYREPVPGFQALHALVPSNEGGASLFADGIALADHLRATALDDFTVLTDTPVPFLYQSKDAELYAERPLIQLSISGHVRAVHYNNRSIAPLNLAARDARRFYAAYRRFAALLREPRFQLRTTLGAGHLVVFDNQRVLHGRTAFSSARFPRHLRGCYLSRDSVYSETALLRRTLSREPA